MGQLLLLTVGALVVGAIGFGIAVLVSGSDPGLVPVEPEGGAVPLPASRPLVESDLAAVRFDTVLRGYRMAQVDLALRRAAYDIGYKQELIGVLEAEVEALREGRTDEADKLREARMAALSAIAGHPAGVHGHPADSDGRPADSDGRPGDADGSPADADGRPGDADAIGEAGATDVIASADEAEDEPSPRPEKTEGDGSWRRPEEMRLS